MNANAQLSQGFAGERLLRKPEVLAKIGLGTTSLYAHIKTGRFPKSIRLGGRAVAWRESEVNGWIADRIAESRGQLAEQRKSDRQ